MQNIPLRTWKFRKVRYNRHMSHARMNPDPGPSPRRVLVVGGLTRLQPQYRDCAVDVLVQVANVNSSRLKHSIGAADAVLVIVPHVSHAAVDRVRRQARRYGVPVARASSSGVGEVTRLIHELTRRATTV